LFRKGFVLFVLIFSFTFFSERELYSQMPAAVKKISKDYFKNFLEKINLAELNDRQIIADDFIAGLAETGYPIFEDDTTAVLLFKGDHKEVNIIGDMTNWANSVPMIKIEGTDLLYYRGKFESTARLEYGFTISKNNLPISDPLNELKSLNGLWEFSVLAMPGYVHHPLFKNYNEGEKGSTDGLEKFEIFSEYLNYTHTVHVYLPPEYDRRHNYHVVYFQDGRDYIEYAAASHVINELILAEKIKPIIAVFVTPPNLHQPVFPNRSTEYGMNENYVDFFSLELVPFIDQKYSTNNSAAGRLVVGDSYGGLISVFISFKYPELFGMTYSQSGYFSFDDDKLIEMINSSVKKDIKLFVDIGTYERHVGADFLPEAERDFLEANRRLKKILEEKEYDFIYKEYFEGHTWGNWRRHLIDALVYFFSNKIQ
jgi:enterochelin esterase-like enzyme